MDQNNIDYNTKKNELKQKFKNHEITKEEFASEYGAIIVMESLQVSESTFGLDCMVMIIC